MNTQEIESIFKEKVDILKKYWNSRPGDFSQKDLKEDIYGTDYNPYRRREKIPPLNPIYRESVELRDMIRVHSDISNKPIELLRKRAPNEDDRQYRYRVLNFENVTMPPFMKALGKLNRIFNPSNYSIQWTKEQTEEKEFFEEEIPVFGNISSYFEEIVLTQKILDPNSLMIVRPYYIPVKEGYDEEGQPILLFDDSQKIIPVACVIKCDDVIDYKESVYALILTEEKSEVRVGDKMVREGLVFEFYDNQNIYRIYQKGEKKDWLFTDPIIYYPHGLGYLPAWKLKGIPQQKDMHVIYQSYFIYAIPNLNIALYAHSNLDLSNVTHMHPQKVEYVDRCNAEGCNNGMVNIWNASSNGYITQPCKACEGTGRMTKTGPMVTKQLLIPDAMQEDNDINKVPPPGVWYVAPNPDVPKFVYEKYKQDVIDAFMFLNMDVSNSDVKGSETALGKQIDREELFAMLLRISNEIFGLFHKGIKAIGEMRYGSGFKTPVVSAPTSFSIRSEQDLLAELAEAKKSGVPDVALREILREYFSKRFSNQAHIEKITNLAFGVDRLITKDQDECLALQATGNASKLEVVLHDSIFTFIENIVTTDDSFWDKTYEEQAKVMWEMAQKKLDEINAAKDKEVANVTEKLLQIDNANAA